MTSCASPPDSTIDQVGFDVDDASVDEECPYDCRDVVRFIDQVAQEKRLIINNHHKMIVRDQRTRADNLSQLPEVLEAENWNSRTFFEELVLKSARWGNPHKSYVLDAGLKAWTRAELSKRKRSLLCELCTPLTTQHELCAAADDWQKWALCFDMEPALAIAVGKNLYRDILRKAAGQDVESPYLYLINSRVQGSGKSYFVSRALTPFEDFVSAPVRSTVLMNPLSLMMLSRYLVINLDDIERLSGRAVDPFKAVITNTELMYRPGHSSIDATVPQNATFVATSNYPATFIIPDETGHRRVIEMPFRNGNVTRGGDSNVWPNANSINFGRLVRSVNLWGYSPLVDYRAELIRHQTGQPLEPELQRWVRELDVSDESVQSLLTPHGIQAQKLYDLYVGMTGDRSMTKPRFANEMAIVIYRRCGPFDQKIDKANVKYYRLRDSGISDRATFS